MDRNLEEVLVKVFDKRVDDSLVIENRLEALKTLAKLLLLEVESLNTTGSKAKIDGISLSDAVNNFEIELIRDALIRAKGNQRSAARILKTKITTLNAKIKRFGIESFWCNKNSPLQESVSSTTIP